MPAEILRASESLLAHVAEPAARSIVLACCAAAVLGALRVRNVAAQTLVWRGVLVAALAMPLLGLLVLPVRVPVPLVAKVPGLVKYVGGTKYVAATNAEPSAKATQHAAATFSEVRPADARASLERTELASQAKVEVLATMEPPSAPVVPVRRQIPWVPLAAAIYAGVALIFLARVGLGIRFASRLERGAAPIEDERVVEIAAEVSRASGLASIPAVAESQMLSVPVTLGVRKPVVLFPAEWREWGAGELEAVLAHEISHVMRRDALVQRLALIHRAIFWFSPFAWWLERHLVDLSEQASDEAALASGADRTRYAETLLGFFATLEAAPQRVWWQGVSMAKLGQAEKRVDRILAWRGAMSTRLTRSLMVVLVAVAAPVVVLTASVHPTVNNFQEPVTSPEQQAAPPPAQRPSPAVAPVVPGESAPSASLVVDVGLPPAEPGAPLVAPVAPVTPGAPMAAIAPVAPMASVGFQDELPAPPMAMDSAELKQAYEAVQRAEETCRKIDQVVAAAKAQVSMSETQAHLDAFSRAMAAYHAAMAKYDAKLNRYDSLLAEARAHGQVYGGISGGVYGGVGGGVGAPQARVISTTPYMQTDDRDSEIKIVGSYSGDWGPRFVIVTKGSEGVTMSGSEEDAEHARSLRSKIPGDYIWFEHDEKSYIIRDQATVDRAKKLWEPQEELGKKQEALGKQQEALGKQQEALGEKMEQVRVKIPDMTADMQALMTRMKELNANGGTQEEIGELQSQIGELQSKVGEIQSDAGRQQSEIGRQQSELGRKQGELGRQQGELGRQQGELAKQATRQMKELLDEAVTTGTAQPE